MRGTEVYLVRIASQIWFQCVSGVQAPSGREHRFKPDAVGVIVHRRVRFYA
jgi:hypothetical protein